jgi:hypothetical protein
MIDNTIKKALLRPFFKIIKRIRPPTSGIFGLSQVMARPYAL